MKKNMTIVLFAFIASINSTFASNKLNQNTPEIVINFRNKNIDYSNLNDVKKGTYFKINVINVNRNLYKISLDKKDSNVAAIAKLPDFASLGLGKLSDMLAALKGRSNSALNLIHNDSSSTEMLFSIGSDKPTPDTIKAKLKYFYDLILQYYNTLDELNQNYNKWVSYTKYVEDSFSDSLYIQRGVMPLVVFDNKYSCTDCKSATDTVRKVSDLINMNNHYLLNEISKVEKEVRESNIEFLLVRTKGDVSNSSNENAPSTKKETSNKRKKVVKKRNQNRNSSTDETPKANKQSNVDTTTFKDFIKEVTELLSEIKNDCITINNNINPSKVADAIKVINFLNLNTNSYTTLPILYNGDIKDIKVNLVPIASGANLSPYDFDIRIPTETTLYFATSGGVMRSSLYDKDHSVQTTIIKNQSSIDTLSKIVDEGSLEYSAGISVLGHLGIRIFGELGINLALGFGTTVTNVTKPQLLSGFGLTYGEKNMISLNVMTSFGMVDRLSSAFDTKTEYRIIPNSYMVSRFCVGLSVSLGYAIQI